METGVNTDETKFLAFAALGQFVLERAYDHDEAASPEEILNLAHDLGIFVEAPDGYDPKLHRDQSGLVDPGDPFWVLDEIYDFLKKYRLEQT